MARRSAYPRIQTRDVNHFVYTLSDKDSGNQAKHGVSLALAAELDWEAALVWVDDRFDYAELRMIALAPKTETLYYVAFIDRGEARRIISLRRANRREVKRYVESIQVASGPYADHGRRSSNYSRSQSRSKRSTAHS